MGVSKLLVTVIDRFTRSTFYSLLGVSRTITKATSHHSMMHSFYSLLGVSASGGIALGGLFGGLSTPFWEFLDILNDTIACVESCSTFLLPFGSFPIIDNGRCRICGAYIFLLPFGSFFTLTKSVLEKLYEKLAFYSLLGVSDFG